VTKRYEFYGKILAAVEPLRQTLPSILDRPS